MDYYMGLQFPLGASVSRARIHGDRIDHARNQIVKAALDINADYILFISDDVLAPPNAFDLLHRHREMLVTGVYWEKKFPTHPYLWNGLLRGPFEDWKMGDYFPVDWAGVDILLAHTDVFRAMPEPWFSVDYSFDESNPHPPLLTEDLYFYTKAREYGFKLYCDSMVQCDHQDRQTLQRFGLTSDMPQYPGVSLHDPGAIMVADLGSGFNTPYFGKDTKVVRYDGDPACHPDVLCDLRAIPANDGLFDLAHMRHVLEHFPPFEAPDIVKEAARILKPGGKLVVDVPNLATAAREILKYDADEKYINWNDYPLWQVYGRQDGSPGELHRNGFTRHGLKRLLEACGLVEVVVTVQGDIDENLHAEGVKVVVEPYVIGDALRAIDERAAATADRAGRAVGESGGLASATPILPPAVATNGHHEPTPALAGADTTMD
jgi:hypothetical protein